MSALRQIRKERKLKQADLASIINTSVVNYCKKENGNLNFSLSEAKLISDFLHMPIEKIFFDDEVSILETN